MTLRQQLRALLIAGVPEVQGRVLEPHAVTAADAAAGPYLVLRVGAAEAPTGGGAWGDTAVPVQVWPYVSRDGSFVTVDALVAKVIAALHRVRFASDGLEYLAEYEGGDGRDFYDEDWQALTRPQRFRVYALGWLSGLTYAPDPVAALRTWTETALPSTQQDPAAWNPQDATPGVYWRLVSAAVAPEGLRSWGVWLDAQLRAHIVTPAAGTRLTTLRQVTERLATTRQLTLSDGSPLFFREIAADSEADPMRTGQVRLTARFGVLDPPVSPAPQPINNAPTTLVTSFP